MGAPGRKGGCVGERGPGGPRFFGEVWPRGEPLSKKPPPGTRPPGGAKTPGPRGEKGWGKGVLQQIKKGVF